MHLLQQRPLFVVIVLANALPRLVKRIDLNNIVSGDFDKYPEGHDAETCRTALFNATDPNVNPWASNQLDVQFKRRRSLHKKALSDLDLQKATVESHLRLKPRQTANTVCELVAVCRFSGLNARIANTKPVYNEDRDGDGVDEIRRVKKGSKYQLNFHFN